jgi:hypothetical protein
LGELERRVIEGYYFDGVSMGKMVDTEQVSLNRALIVHRQALRQLRVILAPFVARMFGIGATCVRTCPICTGDWRADAEAIMDGKTPEMTWGQVMARIERATGWRARGPQTLIAHQRAHRTFQIERTDDEQADVAGGTCIEIEDLDGTEEWIGEPGAGDRPAACGCVPDSPLDGTAASGGNG